MRESFMAENFDTVIEKDRDSYKNIWDSIQIKLKLEFGDATYKSWLSKLNFVTYDNFTLTLNAPTKFMKDWVVTHYLQKITKFWKDLDSNLLAVEVINGASPVGSSHPKTPGELQAALSANSSSGDFASTRRSVFTDNIRSILDARFTFNNFVVGAPNELAYAAARMVADSSNIKMESNPLFLYGGVGLGKTHLMHAIAWHIIQNHADKKVIYLSAEKFMYLFIQALRNKEIMAFKEYFRSVDVLMIDDVQFICGKDSTQEEFFHTFNTLVDNGCQMVISADRSPTDLDGMEDRVKSRLGWGLVVDVHSTTYELRLGILQSKIEQLGISVPKDVLEFLASKITSNVRELEGALNKVVAQSKLIGKEITIENTHEILRDLLRSVDKVITIEDIQKKVSEHFNLKISDLMSVKRLRSMARPRQIAMHLSKTLTNKSLAEIGKKFGGKDHTTVMHAIKTIDSLIASDNEIAEDVRLLTRKISN